MLMDERTRCRVCAVKELNLNFSNNTEVEMMEKEGKKECRNRVVEIDLVHTTLVGTLY